MSPAMREVIRCLTNTDLHIVLQVMLNSLARFVSAESALSEAVDHPS